MTLLSTLTGMVALLSLVLPVLLHGQTPTFTLYRSYPVAEPLPAALSIASGDLNGDGRPEILIGRTGGIAIYDPARAAFSPAIETGCELHSAALADFDRDGALDLAAFCPESGRLSIRRGDGGGRFLPPLVIPLQPASSLSGLAAADLDQDDIPDLVVTQPGSLALLFGVGDGSFRPARSLAIGARFSPANPASVVAADFDNNGIPDLATANIIYDDDVSIFLGTGAGEFKPEVKISTGQRPTALVSTDFDQDGNADLAVAAQGATLILAGRGDGTFHRSDLSTNARAMSVAAGDLNADGLPDLAVGMYYGGVIAIYLNRGGMRFEDAAPVASVGDVFSVVLTDLNADSMLDLVASSVSGSSAVLALGRGDGGFQSLAYLGTAPANSLLLRPVKTGQNAALAVIADRGRTITFLGDGAETRRLAASGYPVDARFGDFDGDGVTDLLAASVADWMGGATRELGGSLAFYRGSPDGSFEQAAASPFPCRVEQNSSYDVLTSMLTLMTGDFNGDGILDAAVSNNPSAVLQVLSGNGDGTFRLVQSIPRTFGRAIAADFDGDGITDIAQVVYAFDGPSPVTFHTGSRGEVPLREQATQRMCDPRMGRMTPQEMQTGDFDGDRRPDIAFACGSAIEILRNTAQGFQLVTVPGASGPGGSPLMTVGDFDNDGRDDIAEARAGAGTRILLYRGGASAILAPPVSTTVASIAVAIAAFDADGDGKTDLALTDNQTGMVRILRSQF